MSEAAERRARRRMYRTGAGFARNEYLAPAGGDRRRPPPGRRHARPGRLRHHDHHRADDRDDQTPAEPGEPVTRPPSRPVPSRARFGAATALRAAGVRPRTVDSRSSASATPRRPCRPLLSVRSSRIRSFSSCLPGARDGPPTGETCSDYDTVCVKSSHGLGRKVFEGGRRSEPPDGTIPVTDGPVAGGGHPVHGRRQGGLPRANSVIGCWAACGAR